MRHADPTVAASPRDAPAGALLRHWRELRRLTQLELSLRAEVSQRHLSWVETGKSRPSRDMVLHLVRVLEVPLRDRNALLHAGGFAPAYPESDWDDEEFAPVREAIQLLLARHEPNPAIVLDRHWSLVDANDAAVRLITTFGGPDAMAAAEGNAMRLLLHPHGLRPAIANVDEVAGHLVDRIVRDAASHPDDADLAALGDELVALAGDVPRARPDAALPLVVTTTLRTGDHEVSLLSMLASVGGALDVTLSELVVELFYPTDLASAATLRALAST